MKTIFKSRKKWVLLIAVLLLCGTLVFALRDWYLPSAAASGTDPTEKGKEEKENPPPEDGEFWIKTIQGTVTEKDKKLTVKFASYTVDFSELEWYNIVFAETAKNEDAQYYRAGTLDGVIGNSDYLERDFVLTADIFLNGQCRTKSSPVMDGPVHGLFLKVYIAKEHRLYNVKTLLTDEQLQIIDQKAKDHTYGNDDLSKLLQRAAAFYEHRGVWEEQEHCTTDEYIFPIMLMMLPY